MLRYQIIPVTHFEQNCSLVWCDETKQAALIDPGGDAPRLLQAVQNLGLDLSKILLTHGHIDHAGAAGELAQSLNIPIEGPQEEDWFWIAQLPAQGQMFGFGACQSFTPNRWLHDGDSVWVGNQTLQVWYCPGHTPGHVVFHHAPTQHAWVGDVLFQGSIGRTDFPKGDLDTLLHSITSKLWPLGNATTFTPGHGAESTFGAERKTNPYVSDSALARAGR